MSTLTCAGCTTIYSHELEACPHCGSVEYTEGGAVIARRLPAFVTLTCACGRGPWQYRLPVVATGLIQLAPLYCASCGSQVQIPWPPKEDAMPKITVHGGPTNARDAEPSPDVDASQPLLAGAEADQEGRPVPFEAVADDDGDEQSQTDGVAAASGDDADAAPDYDGMTLAELREEATRRELPSYGTKAQITERLREDDLDEE
jgi:rRNA maturation protein Nop10